MQSGHSCYQVTRSDRVIILNKLIYSKNLKVARVGRAPTKVGGRTLRMECTYNCRWSNLNELL